VVPPTPGTAPLFNAGRGHKLPGRSLIRTAWLDELGEILAREAEPKRFSFLDRTCHAPSELTLLALPRTRFYGMSHGSAVLCKTANLDCFEFMFVIDGKLLSGLPGSMQRVTAGSGEAVLHLPGRRHCASWEPGSRAVILRIDPNMLGPFGYDRQRFAELGRGSPIYPIQVDSGLGRTLVNICGQICEEAESAISIDEQMRQEDLLLYAVELIVEGLSGSKAAGPDRKSFPPYLMNTLEYISANLERKLDAQTLARASGMSIRTLQQAFADHLGISPLTFIKQARLRRIRHELLRASRWETTVTDIAVRWGFTHLSNFSSSYKKLFGESPSRTLKKRSLGTLAPHLDSLHRGYGFSSAIRITVTRFNAALISRIPV